jgi:hypothetical protein
MEGRNEGGMIRKQRLGRPALKRIIGFISSTREQEIDCDQCLAELDEFAETVLEGRELTEAQLLVRDHLSRCAECKEEYELLLQALYHMEEE